MMHSAKNRDEGLSYKGEISPFGRDDKKRTLA